jgi:hypothetical protein
MADLMAAEEDMVAQEAMEAMARMVTKRQAQTRDIGNRLALIIADSAIMVALRG